MASGKQVWLIEKRRGVRVTADMDDAHGMVALAKTHYYEKPSQEAECAAQFEVAEAARQAAAASPRAESMDVGGEAGAAHPSAAGEG